MEQMALGWLVFEITDSPFMVGVAASANMAPFFLFGVLSGAVADRADRRVVIRLISLCSAITAALMALILLTSDLADITVWYPIALAFAMGSVWAFSQTFRHAYTYDIVGRELALNGLSLTGSAQMAGQIGGALLAGVLIEAVGPGPQYLAACGAYLLALSVLLWTRPTGRADLTRAEPVLQQMLGYVRLVRGNRTLLALMCFTALVEIFGFTHQSLLPVFAKENLGVGAVGLGVMTAVRRGGGVPWAGTPGVQRRLQEEGSSSPGLRNGIRSRPDGLLAGGRNRRVPDSTGLRQRLRHHCRRPAQDANAVQRV